VVNYGPRLRTTTDLARAATLPAAAVLAELDTDADGLTGTQAASCATRC
jgi:hypothetical protein